MTPYTLQKHDICVLAGAHLRVCIEDFDSLGRDEQINLSESLCVSICTLLQHNNTFLFLFFSF